jgi:tetratricopeptide (TPR) repeat protein
VGIAAARGRAESVIPVISRLYEKYVLTKANQGLIGLLPHDQPYVYSRIENKESLHRTALEWYKRQAGQQMAGDRGDQHGLGIYETIFYHALRAKEPTAASQALFDSRLADSFEWTDKLQTLLYLCRQLQEFEGFESVSPKYRGEVCFYLGYAARQLGNLDEAERCLAQADQFFGDAGNTVRQAAALTELGLVNRKKGNYGSGELDYYEYALKLLEGQQNAEAKIVRCRIFGRKGQALQREGADAAEVFRHLDGAVKIAREVGDKGVLAARLGALATAHRELGQRDFPAAIRCCQEALALAEEIQSAPAIVGALRALGMTYEKSHRLAPALELYLRAFEKTNKADIYGMIDRLSVLAHVYKSLQRLVSPRSTTGRHWNWHGRLRTGKPKPKFLTSSETCTGSALPAKATKSERKHCLRLPPSTMRPAWEFNCAWRAILPG